MPATGPFDLQRFLDAQSGVYDTALAELRGGRKRSHWIWFVFPQLTGLGRSPTAQRFGISGIEEARAYLAHPVLGPRLHECARLLARIRGRSAEEILGHPDDLKVRSAMTLFVRAAETMDGADPADFRAVLDALYAGHPDGRDDRRTLDLLAQSGSATSQPCGGTTMSVTTRSRGAPEPAITVAGPGSRTDTGPSATLSATTRPSRP